MTRPPDLNLLIVLDALLEEGSVTGAAQRMGVSAPSMSRALARIRQAVGDPILVRAGRSLVPTPRALALRNEVRGVIEEAAALLRPEGLVSFRTLERRFTIRANEGFTGVFASRLLDRIAIEAPLAVIRFAPEGEVDDDSLRDGRVDLDIGALRAMGPEVRVQTIFRDLNVGVARAGHPIFAGMITPERFVAYGHISVSRRGRAEGPIDRRLASLGLTRRVPLVVPSFHAALLSVCQSDLIGLAPTHVLNGVGDAKWGLRTFEIPLPLETVVMAQAWHPRFDRDAAHRLLRGAVRDLCAEVHPRLNELISRP
ncbi:MAG: LysR family transcriptional regulator [Telmatospirillum sp.]|nr:LysR family transcriptional regulator [Telmatospirillum sp.]